MKRLHLTIVLAMLCVAWQQVRAEEYSGTCGDNLEWSLDTETGVLEISGSGEMTDYSSYEDIPWYSNREYISSIVIKDGVTTIGQRAFYDCTSLTSVEIPNSVTSIGFWAFYNCTGLTDLTIPNGVKSLNCSFTNCTGLTNITIPNSVTSISPWEFEEYTGIVTLQSVVPLTISSTTFSSSAVFAVPSEAYDDYCSAKVWSDIAARIVKAEYTTVSVNVEATEGTSGILQAVGEDNVGGVLDLTVAGSINSYDIIVIRDKMPNLSKLDLSGATVVASSKAFYNGHCTGDNDLGAYAFYNLTKLQSVKLPAGITCLGNQVFNSCTGLTSIDIPSTVQSIGANAFQGCKALRSVGMPQTMQSIDNFAFYGCSKLTSIDIPAGVKAIKYATFECCSALASVTLPDGLTSIDQRAFNCCDKLAEIKFPPTLETIAASAFSSCGSLTEVRIPSSVQSIESSAFAGCLAIADVYTYTVEPTSIEESTFATFTTATLHVPSQSYYNYYWDDGWKRFLSLDYFDEPYEYFYINNDYTLDENTGYIDGAPDADINAGSGLIIEGEVADGDDVKQELGNVNVKHDGAGKGGSIIADNNLHADSLHIRINVTGGRWYFFAFPYEIPLKNIKMQGGSNYVFRYYDGEERAKNGKGGWKNVSGDCLKAANGYIFQCSANDVLVLSLADIRFKKSDRYNELVEHVTENTHDASWNFVGNPYLSYYDISNLGYDAPITVWNGSSYEAIRPGDDDYQFAPFEAYFVQKPEGQDKIDYKGDERITHKQAENRAANASMARSAATVNRDRLLVNVTIGNDEASDRTRVVFNNRSALGYEKACDAAKFETAGVPQLYTLDAAGVRYAINERPADSGVVSMGFSVPVEGVYTISATRMDTKVWLKDSETALLHDLSEGAYTFRADAGTNNARFSLVMRDDSLTGIENIVGSKELNGCDVYDIQGRRVLDILPGNTYIVNGKKVFCNE